MGRGFEQTRLRVPGKRSAAAGDNRRIHEQHGRDLGGCRLNGKLRGQLVGSENAKVSPCSRLAEHAGQSRTGAVVPAEGVP